MPTLLSSPLLQVGLLVFDAELQVGRGQSRQYTERRIAAGAVLSDHSFVAPREYQLQGGVSAIAQLQNLGRPGAEFATASAAAFTQVGQTVAANLVGIQFTTRLQDFEADLEALVDLGAEVEVVSKVIGRRRAVVTSWQAQTTPDDGDAAIYSLTLREVQRALGLSITNPTEQSAALVGSGTTTPLGATPAPLVQVPFTP